MKENEKIVLDKTLPYQAQTTITKKKAGYNIKFDVSNIFLLNTEAIALAKIILESEEEG